MVVKRKLDGGEDKSSVNLEICKSYATVYITCEKSGGLNLVQSGLTAGRQTGSLTDEIKG